MVIKRFPGGESAGDGRSTSKSTCADPAWSLTAFGDRPQGRTQHSSKVANEPPARNQPAFFFFFFFFAFSHRGLVSHK